MAAGAYTDFFINKLVDFIFRAQALGITGATAAAGTGPATLYVGLFTAAPNHAGGGTEVSGGSYARQPITSALTAWAGTQGATTTAASSGANGGTGLTTSNNAAVVFSPAPTGNWGSILAFGLFDALSTGNLLLWAAVSPAQTVNNGDPAPQFNISALTATLN
jgi:hypothetical protein